LGAGDERHVRAVKDFERHPHRRLLHFRQRKIPAVFRQAHDLDWLAVGFDAEALAEGIVITHHLVCEGAVDHGHAGGLLTVA